MNGIRVSILFILCSIVCSIVPAQTISTVHGRIESSHDFLGTDYTVELEDRARPGPRYEAAVSFDGSFEIRNLAAGQYNLRLLNRGDVVYEQFMDSMHAVGQLTIRLPEQPSTTRPGPATVSVRELQRPAPEKAMRAFAAAGHFLESGRELEGVRKLEQAVRIYPQYSEARSNLGIEYLRLGRRQEALEQFEKALASDPPSSTLLANLSYTLCALGRLPEAERAARRALEIDKSNGRAHYLLGSILAKSVLPGALQQAPEAAQHLRLGAGDVHQAHLDIASMYLAEGDQLGAAEEMRLYLKSGDTRHRADVERWLSQLTARSKPQSPDKIR